MGIEKFIIVLLVGYALLLELERREKIKGERYLFIFIFRTKRGKEIISKIARFKRFWLFIGNIGILVGILGMFAIFFFLYSSLYSQYFLKQPIGGVQLVIPGVTIPFWYGVLGLASVIIVHEIAHGILAIREGVPIKSLGIALVTIIPIGAFVEPDEEVLNNSNSGAKLRVYSAGSFANLTLAFLAFGILVAFSGFFFSSGVEIVDIAKDSPSEGILEKGMIITSINGEEILTIEDFKKISMKIKPNEKIEIKTDKGVFYIKAGRNPEDPSRGFLGIFVTSPLKKGLSEFLFLALSWISFLNQGIGLINLAPIHFGVAATDGYHILKEILSKLTLKAEKISMAISTLTFLTILLIMIAPKIV